ncbi:MAG: cysteine desulfurase, partial [Candidatus Pacebacteria bacterium]|nr:cysteine desulfurase [Candidatus Paceibacterota bacterium]
MFKKLAKNKIYLDYAAAAPELTVSKKAALRASRYFGNPSSIHKDGLAAAEILKEARADIAYTLGALPEEIIFCGSGTESDNLAILGVFKHLRLSKEFVGKDLHFITTVIEHPAVLEAHKHIEAMGAKVTYLPVGDDGLVNLKDLRAAFTPETVLVSIAYANNEIGTVQPVREIAKEIRHYRKIIGTDDRPNILPLFHSDACQATPYLNLTVAQLGVDFLTFNGTKLGGPRGTGVLYVRRGAPLVNMFYGGDQEYGFRSGTENVPGIAGLARALREVHRIKDRESSRVRRLRDYFLEEIKKRFPNARINGSLEFRLPNNVHVSFPNFQSELLVLELDARGISASAGSACSASKDGDSHVMTALCGEGDGKKWGSVRFSLGGGTKKSHINRTLSALSDIQKKY